MDETLSSSCYNVLSAGSGDRSYTYAGPPGLVPGTLVTAPFGSRVIRGIVVSSDAKPRPDCRELELLASDLLPIPVELMHTLDELADYYMVPVSSMIRCALPPVLSRDLPSRYHLSGKKLPLVLTEPELALVAWLEQKPRTKSAIARKMGADGSDILRRLMRMGLVDRRLALEDQLVDSVKRRAVVAPVSA